MRRLHVGRCNLRSHYRTVSLLSHLLDLYVPLHKSIIEVVVGISLVSRCSTWLCEISVVICITPILLFLDFFSHITNKVCGSGILSKDLVAVPLDFAQL